MCGISLQLRAKGGYMATTAEKILTIVEEIKKIVERTLKIEEESFKRHNEGDGFGD